MKGILADINIQGQMDLLVALMAADPWKLYWDHLRLPYRRFGDVGLEADDRDSKIWNCCQAQELVLVTGNRNKDGPDSLEAMIHDYSTTSTLPVLTIADSQRVLHSRAYADRVIEQMLDYLLCIDSVRGVGRLYLP